MWLFQALNYVSASEPEVRPEKHARPQNKPHIKKFHYRRENESILRKTSSDAVPRQIVKEIHQILQGRRSPTEM